MADTLEIFGTEFTNVTGIKDTDTRDRRSITKGDYHAGPEKEEWSAEL